MNPPFTQIQFFEVFRAYNETVFPMQFIFYILCFVVIYLTLKPNNNSDKTISTILSFFWVWMGIVYHLIFFSSVNPLAYLFGMLFIIQGILFFITGVIQNKFSFKYSPDMFSITGIIMISYALLIYPVFGNYLGHVYPYSPTFGLPCPTTIFTFGLLLLNVKKCPPIILIIPLIWSVIGSSAVFIFGIAEDSGLIISAVIASSMLLHRNAKLSKTHISVKN